MKSRFVPVALFLVFLGLSSSANAFTFKLVNADEVFTVGQRVLVACSLTKKEHEDGIRVTFRFQRAPDYEISWPADPPTIGDSPADCGGRIKLPPVAGNWRIVATDQANTFLGQRDVKVEVTKTPGAIAAGGLGEEIFVGQKLKFTISHDQNRTYYCGRLMNRKNVYTGLAVVPVETDISTLNRNVPEGFGQNSFAPIDCRWVNGNLTHNAGSSELELQLPDTSGRYVAVLVTMVRRHFHDGSIIENVVPVELDRTIEFEVQPIPVERVYATFDPYGKQEVSTDDARDGFITGNTFYLWAEFARDHPGFPETMTVEAFGEYEDIPVELHRVETRLHRGKVDKSQLITRFKTTPGSGGRFKFVDEDADNRCEVFKEESALAAEPRLREEPFDGFLSGEPILFPVNSFMFDKDFYSVTQDIRTVQEEYERSQNLTRNLLQQANAEFTKAEEANQLLVDRAKRLGDAYRSKAGQAAYSLESAKIMTAFEQRQTAHEAYRFARLRAAANILRADAIDLKLLRTVLKYYEESKPPHIKQVVVRDDGVVKYCATWSAPPELQKRQEEDERVFEALAELKKKLDFVRASHDAVKEDWQAIDAKMMQSIQDYRWWIQFDGVSDGVIDGIASSASGYVTGGFVGVIAELFDSLVSAAVWKRYGNTWFADYSRKYPTYTAEYRAARGLALAESLSFDSNELIQMETLIQLKQSPVAMDSDFLTDIDRRTATELQKVAEGRDGIEALTVVSDSRHPTIDYIQSLGPQKSWTKSIFKTSTKWGLQPPGGPSLLPVKWKAGALPANRITPAEAWRQFKDRSWKESSSAALGNLGNAWMIRRAADAAKASKNAITNSEQLYVDYLTQELEWFFVRREYMATKALLDVFEAAYLNDLRHLILNELIGNSTATAFVEREKQILINKPVEDEGNLQVTAILSDSTFLVTPVLADFDYQGAYEGIVVRDVSEKMRIAIRDIDDYEASSAKRIVFPRGIPKRSSSGAARSSPDSTWTWTLDSNPRTPAVTFDLESFYWDGNDDKRLVDDTHEVFFSSSIEFRLRSKSSATRIVH